MDKALIKAELVRQQMQKRMAQLHLQKATLKDELAKSREEARQNKLDATLQGEAQANLQESLDTLMAELEEQWEECNSEIQSYNWLQKEFDSLFDSLKKKTESIKSKS